MSYPHSVVAIWPESLHNRLSAMVLALGYTIGEGAPLSSDGEKPATHRGMHAWARPSFVALITGRAALAIDGYTDEQISAALGQLVVSVDNGEGREHFDRVLAANGLHVVDGTRG